MIFLATSPYHNPTTYTSCESLMEQKFSTASHLTIIKRHLEIKLLMVGTVFKFAKVNTVSCMFIAALSWIAST